MGLHARKHFEPAPDRRAGLKLGTYYPECPIALFNQW